MTEGRKRNVRFHAWLHDEIEAIAAEKGKTFTDMVNYFLEDELNHLGYTRVKYEAQKLNLGRNANQEGNEKEGFKTSTDDMHSIIDIRDCYARASYKNT